MNSQILASDALDSSVPAAQATIGADRLAPSRLIRPGPAIVWILAAAILTLVLARGSSFQLYVGGIVMIYAVSALGLEWLMGRTGQVSLGNAALMAVGAYTTAIVAPESWAPFPIPVLISTLVGAVIGLVVGLPALRLRGIYLALATLALHFIVVFAADRYQKDTEQISGLSVPVAEIAGVRFVQGRSFFALLAIVLAAVVLLLANLYRHSPGRLWMSIRESELGASALGVEITRWKLTAFVGSSALIAFSGSLLAYYSRSVSWETFSLDLAISFIVMIILGGMGWMSGAILGATLVTILPYVIRSISDRIPDGTGLGSWLARNIYHVNYGLYGVVLILVLLYRPAGLAPAVRDVAHWIARRGNRSAPAPLAATTGAAPAGNRGGAAPTSATTTPGPASTATVGAGDALLDVRGLTVTYEAGARAVDEVDLFVAPGEIVAILGRNGAGKTSTLRGIGGFFRSEGADVHGTVRFDGHELSHRTPMATAAMGIVLIPERDKVFPSISTADHLRMAAPRGRVRDEIFDLFPWLRDRGAISAGLLSGGERQMLAMAMAWLLRPRLMLVDELSLGLAPIVVRDLLAKLVEINAREGMAILLVEQNATAALSVSHRAYVLDSGRIVAQGAAAELAHDEALKAAYLGGVS